jgi:hypothetical protein
MGMKYAAFNLQHARAASTHTRAFFHSVDFDPVCLFAFTAVFSELKSGGMVAEGVWQLTNQSLLRMVGPITLGLRRLLLLWSRSCSHSLLILFYPIIQQCVQILHMYTHI